MAGDRDEPTAAQRSVGQPRSDVEPRVEFALVRPYIASLGDPEASDWRAGRGPMVPMDPPEPETVRLDPVRPSDMDDTDVILGLDTPGRHRRAGRLGAVAASGAVLVIVLTGAYLLWTPRASPAQLLVVPPPAPLPDFSTVTRRPGPSAASPTTAHPSRSRPATPSGPPSPSPSLRSHALATNPGTPSASPSPPSTPPAKPVIGALIGPGGLCLDDNNASTQSGNKIQLFGCNGTPAQQWTVQPDGTLQVVGKCLSETSRSPGGRVVLWDCDGSNGEMWRPGKGNAFVNGSSGLCLDDPGGSTDSGTWLDVAQCDDSASQSWTMQ